MSLPALPDAAVVAERLLEIFPEGTAQRTYCVRDTASKVVLTALYMGAVEGADVYFGPRHVYRMSDQRLAKLRTDSHRKKFALSADAVGKRWYADNSREQIRDETINQGLAPNNAVKTRSLATTSSLPRYALQAGFAALFDPALTGKPLEDAIANWQSKNLSAAGRARAQLLKRAKAGSKGAVTVTLPDGETRKMSPGDSSQITRAVIEEFAPRFLKEPTVVWISESGRKVVERDDKTAKDIGINIKVEKELPDCILFDAAESRSLLVFVEVVATDGAITEKRRTDLTALAPGFKAEDMAFVTAFMSRTAGPFRKLVSELAWDSFAWFLAEPERLVVMWDASDVDGKLSDLLPTRRTYSVAGFDDPFDLSQPGRSVTLPTIDTSKRSTKR